MPRAIRCGPRPVVAGTEKPKGSTKADEVLNKTPDYTATHVFSTADVTGTFDGLTQGDVLPGDAPVIDFTAAPKVTKDGVNLYPINSEFGFNVSDFEGAIEKDFVLDPEFNEGWAGDLKGVGGEQIGLVLSDSPTDTFKTPALLGTWLAGIGGNTVKASTEHYSVMQNVLSDQRYPGDLLAKYPLDDNLRVVGGDYDGQYVADVIPQVGDVNGDGVQDIKDVLLPNESTIQENIAVSDDYSVTLKDDGKLLYRWGNTIKRPNDIRIEAELPLPDEWSDPDDDNGGLIPLYRVTEAELLVNHTITNNPNDQIRPEDFENESAIGKLPTYQVLSDGRWVSVGDYYAGDGTFYPAGTVLRDPALATKVDGGTLDSIGATSADLDQGFTNAWYTTMDREPFEAELTPDGLSYVTGPRWRLQSDKYGQDLPSVVMPEDPSLPPPPTQDQVKYEVGEDTQTVINLLDWANPVSPLSISAGWQNNSGTVSVNGLNMTENFDVAFYIKGDIKPATIYDTQLIMSYDEITIHDAGTFISGEEGDDYLVGQGGNTFIGDRAPAAPGEDLFVLSYGVTNDYYDIQTSTVLDFTQGADTLGMIDLSVTEANFAELVGQVVQPDGLHISLGGIEIAILSGVTAPLGFEDFLVVNRTWDKRIFGTVADEFLVGDDYDNKIYGDDGEDTLLGLGGDDTLFGGAGDDVLNGGTGDDNLLGEAGADTLIGGQGTDTATYLSSAFGVTVDLATGTGTGGDAQGDTLSGIENLVGSDHDDVLTGDAGDNRLVARAGEDTLIGGDGNDVLRGGDGADVLDGGDGIDVANYSVSTAAVIVNLTTGVNVGGTASGDSLISIEGVTGSDYSDTLVGDTGSNRLAGRDGDDSLDGGDGDDHLTGGMGADALIGGNGSDVASYAFSGDAVSVNLLSGATAGGEAAGDTLSSIENLIGSAFDDALTGDGFANLLRGGEGDDILDGGAGDDVLNGEGGDDMFIFNAGSDSIDGGEGADFALFTGSMVDFDVTDLGAGSWTVTHIATGDIDSLIGVETLGFSDGYLFA